MGAFIETFTFDARDALVSARFRASALGTDVDVGAEVERLTALGATIVDDRPELVVMADPEGNEFCVEPGREDPS